jgi:hypothetical protein
MIRYAYPFEDSPLGAALVRASMERAALKDAAAAAPPRPAPPRPAPPRPAPPLRDAGPRRPVREAPRELRVA